MDERDATRIAIAETRHNLALIANELSHRARDGAVRQGVKTYVLSDVVGLPQPIARHPLRAVAVALGAVACALLAAGAVRALRRRRRSRS